MICTHTLSRSLSLFFSISHTHTYTHIHTRTCTHTHKHVCIYIYTDVRMCVCACVRCMCVYVCVCMHIQNTCIHISLCKCAQIFQPSTKISKPYPCANRFTDASTKRANTVFTSLTHFIASLDTAADLFCVLCFQTLPRLPRAHRSSEGVPGCLPLRGCFKCLYMYENESRHA